jgi:hypothetical protein
MGLVWNQQRSYSLSQQTSPIHEFCTIVNIPRHQPLDQNKSLADGQAPLFHVRVPVRT